MGISYFGNADPAILSMYEAGFCFRIASPAAPEALEIMAIYGQTILSQIRTGFNKINGHLLDKNIDAASETLKSYNSVLSKAVKRGIIKKRNASRKLSSLSGQIKK